MKKGTKIILICVISFFVLAIIFVFFFINPIIYEKKCMDRIYQNIDEKITDENIQSSISFLYLEEEINDNVTSFEYSYGNNGVIIKKEENTYYALTVKHVVSDVDNMRVFLHTPYTELNNLLQIRTKYNSSPKLKIEMSFDELDLVMFSFTSNEELCVAEIASNGLKYNDKIVTIGYDNGVIKKQYGNIKSHDKISFTSDGITSFCYKHNCYIKPGYSGSPVYNENMELIGINIGGTINGFNRFKCGYFAYINNALLERS